jgi:2-dehydropantoate 2-reductase
VAEAAGYPVSAGGYAANLDMFIEEGGVFTSSLYRDVSASSSHKGEHLAWDSLPPRRTAGH